MIDTLSFVLWSNQVGGTRLMQAVAPYLDADLWTPIPKRGSFEVSGIRYKDKNLTFNIYDDKLELARGSLCKYILGNNVQSITRKDIKAEIERLSDTFHQPLGIANITRLDVGWNIITSEQPENYYQHLGELPRFSRVPFLHTLYYTQVCKWKAIRIYNKGWESRANMPTLYRGKEVLRYEVSWLKHVAEQLKVDKLDVQWLYDYENMQYLSKILYGYYKQIIKVCNYQINFDYMSGIKDMNDLGIIALIEKVGGLSELYEQLNVAQRQGKLSAPQKKKMKDAIECAISKKKQNNFTADSELIAELDEKFLSKAMERV